MKEPHKKGLANHLGPESCADGRKVVGEALTGEDAGQPLSSEITSTGVPTSCYEGEGYTKGDATRKSLFDAAESETLSLLGNSLREDRETSETPTSFGARDGRRRPRP